MQYFYVLGPVFGENYIFWDLHFFGAEIFLSQTLFWLIAFSSPELKIKIVIIKISEEKIENRYH